MLWKTLSASLAASLLLASVAAAQESELSLTLLGRYETGLRDEGAQEIAAYHVGTQTLFVVNGANGTVDLLNISDPAAPSLTTQLDFSDLGDGVNSVAVSGDLVAVAIDNDQEAGQVAFLNPDGSRIATYEVGALPDMVTFTPDGRFALTANEGEPSDDYTVDPEGSVSIIDLSNGAEAATVTTVGFQGVELPAEVRVFGPNATPAQDLEPEYIAVTPDSATAYVTLQENNALAVIDIASASVQAVVALGFKDHSLEGNGMDASDEDGGINISPRPVLGMYQPDGIYAFEVGGQTYLITANEGDARDYDGFSEQARVEDLTLDAEAYPDGAGDLARLRTTTTLGDTDGDGDVDQIYSFGARSFTIWDATGALVYDSGDMLEQLTAELVPDAFNSEGLAESFDSRSDDKGPEPEGVTVGVINDVPYAFLGLERIGGVMVFNLSDPTAPTFVTYANNTDYQGSFEEGTFTGDIAPEGVLFIPAEDSPNGAALLVLANEVSGTTTLYQVN